MCKHNLIISIVSNYDMTIVARRATKVTHRPALIQLGFESKLNDAIVVAIFLVHLELE